MSIPDNYLELVYAGVLGKIIGVYLGRPFEGWTYERIMAELGEVNYYVHDKLNVPLIVTDDDISGTFTFIRALSDYMNSPNISPAQIGQTWMNYIIEEQSILWWGGMGNSTEHTAYLRMKSGIEAPKSGSMALNGQVVAEQIGAQIFIDGWGMVSPGDPEKAADFARRAASVSHDGEAIYGAQIIAAMEALAFVESDVNKLIDTALSLIPDNSIIYGMIQDIREWHATEPDWHQARKLLEKHYGYDSYGGNCHMIPNHGLIIFSLLYGDDNFQKSLMIVNTAGWDTDCNSGNLGCLLGIKNGLESINQDVDWRTPIADRLYLPTADGGRAISDAVIESYHLVNTGRALQNLDPIHPKDNARFHFELPGAIQGFVTEDSQVATIENVEGFSEKGKRSLAIHCHSGTARVETATFTPSHALSQYFDERGYSLLASPTLYSGQMIQARLVADPDNKLPLNLRLYIKRYDENDNLKIVHSDIQTLNLGEALKTQWKVPDTHNYPIALIGIEVTGSKDQQASIYLDYLTWDGVPDTTFNRPIERQQKRAEGLSEPVMWKKSWVAGFDHNERLTDSDYWDEPYRLIQNKGRGLLIQGTREWTDYRLYARMTPHMCRAGGVAVRVQGMNRYYALLLDHESTKIIRAFEGKDTILAQVDSGWEFGRSYDLNLQVKGNKLIAAINGQLILETEDSDNMFTGGGIALISEVGRIACDSVSVHPIYDTSHRMLKHDG